MFDRPTFATLIDRITADILARLGNDDALRRADAPVYGRVQAAESHGLYGHLEFVLKQSTPYTATDEYLDWWCASFGITRKVASAAIGTVTVTTTVGAVVPAATTRMRAVEGAEYSVSAAATATGATLTLAITAAVAGVAGNRGAGQVLTLLSPVAGVSSTGTTGVLSGGADVETDDALRARLMARLQLPPQGGSNADYVEWCTSIAGITRAFVRRLEGSTEVYLYVMADGNTDPIPGAALVAAVQTYIDSVRPVTADVTVAAPTAAPLNITLRVVPDTAAVRAAVTAEVRDWITREAEPGVTLPLSRLSDAISGAVGETSHTLLSPTADMTFAAGAIATFGSITWS